MDAPTRPSFQPQESTKNIPKRTCSPYSVKNDCFDITLLQLRSRICPGSIKQHDFLRNGFDIFSNKSPRNTAVAEYTESFHRVGCLVGALPHQSHQKPAILGNCVVWSLKYEKSNNHSSMSTVGGCLETYHHTNSLKVLYVKLLEELWRWLGRQKESRHMAANATTTESNVCRSTPVLIGSPYIRVALAVIAMLLSRVLQINWLFSLWTINMTCRFAAKPAVHGAYDVCIS